MAVDQRQAVAEALAALTARKGIPVGPPPPSLAGALPPGVLAALQQNPKLVEVLLAQDAGGAVQTPAIPESAGGVPIDPQLLAPPPVPPINRDPRVHTESFGQGGATPVSVLRAQEAAAAPPPIPAAPIAPEVPAETVAPAEVGTKGEAPGADAIKAAFGKIDIDALRSAQSSLESTAKRLDSGGAKKEGSNQNLILAALFGLGAIGSLKGGGAGEEAILSGLSMMGSAFRSQQTRLDSESRRAKDKTLGDVAERRADTEERRLEAKAGQVQRQQDIDVTRLELDVVKGAQTAKDKKARRELEKNTAFIRNQGGVNPAVKLAVKSGDAAVKAAFGSPKELNKIWLDAYNRALSKAAGPTATATPAGSGGPREFASLAEAFQALDADSSLAGQAVIVAGKPGRLPTK